MAFVSTARKSAKGRSSVALQGMGVMASAAIAARKTPGARPLHRLGNFVLGDLGKTAAGKPSVFRTRFHLSGLGDVTCSIDPVTGGRVCSSPDQSSTATPAAAAATTPAPNWNCNGVVSPRYISDPTSQKWDWNVNMPATWIFAGRPDPNSVYDIYVRQDNGQYASVGPGGGFQYQTFMRPTVQAYSACPAPPTAAAAAPSTAATIQPAAPATSMPAPFVASTAPAIVPAFKPTDWTKIGLIGSAVVVGGLFLKKLLK